MNFLILPVGWVRLGCWVGFPPGKRATPPVAMPQIAGHNGVAAPCAASAATKKRRAMSDAAVRRQP